MANIQTEIQKITFDISDAEITTVTVEIKHNDDGVLLKNVYSKTFPARISILDLVKNYIPGYLLW